nr:reverse transcriptase domain-containing protein [Tanacetum cinerariifolium]
MTREALKIIENKSKVHYSRSKSNVSRVNTNSRDNSSKTDDIIDKLADQISNLVEIVNNNQPSVCAATSTYNQNNQGYRAAMNNAPNFQNQVFQNQPFQVPNNQIQPDIPNELSSNMKSNETLIRNMQIQINVLRGDFNKQEENLRRNLNNDMRSILGSFFQNQALTSGTLQSNTVPNPKGEIKVVTTRSGLAYEGPPIPTNSSLEKVVKRETEEITDKEHSNCQGSIAQVQPLKFFQIFRDLHFDISFMDALLLMPKFASTIKSLLTNKDKLFELAKVPLNENCSAMLLKKPPEKLGDLGKFLIPCDFHGIDVCHALADLGASINLMRLSIWKNLSLPELTPTRMTLELADRSIAHPKGVVKDVLSKWGNKLFELAKVPLNENCSAMLFKKLPEKLGDPEKFLIPYFEADLRVLLILGRSFLRTDRALIDVYGEKISLRYNPNSSNPTLVSDPLISESDCSEETKAKSSTEEPLELELKELPSHLEYAFLEESNKLPGVPKKGGMTVVFK